MIVGIKATQIGAGGGMTHLVQLLKWFAELAPYDRFVVYGNSAQERCFNAGGGNIELRFFKSPSRGLLSRLAWEHTQLPRIVKADNCDLLFEPGNYATPGLPCPSVILIHNLAPFVPEYVKIESTYQKLRLKLLRRQTLEAIKSAAGVIFLSEYARQIISSQSRYCAKGETVIYHGASSDAEPQTLNREPASPIFRNCILCVSHIYRYKGILELVAGYSKACATNAELPALVIVGAPYDKAYTAGIRQAISRNSVESRVHLVGSVSEVELHRLYMNCRFLVFPSKIENCPNILLEAMNAGCAIACSSASVMPEICGDAAIYFDPTDPDSIAARILELHHNEALRRSLSERAKKRAADFSWRATGQQTLDFLRVVCSSGNTENSLAIPKTTACLKP